MAVSRTLLQQLLVYLNFSLKRFNYCYKRGKKKKMISMNYGSSTRSLKPRRWVRVGLIFTMKDKNSTRIAITYAMKWDIPLRVWRNVNGNRDNNIIRISQWRESHCWTNTSIRINKLIKKSRIVRVTVKDSSRTVNHLSKVIWEDHLC